MIDYLCVGLAKLFDNIQNQKRIWTTAEIVNTAKAYKYYIYKAGYIQIHRQH